MSLNSQKKKLQLLDVEAKLWIDDDLHCQRTAGSPPLPQTVSHGGQTAQQPLSSWMHLSEDWHVPSYGSIGVPMNVQCRIQLREPKTGIGLRKITVIANIHLLSLAGIQSVSPQIAHLGLDGRLSWLSPTASSSVTPQWPWTHWKGWGGGLLAKAGYK